MTVTGEDRGDVVVTGAREAKVKDDGSIEVKSRSGSVSVRCPQGSDVIVGANSGRVELVLVDPKEKATWDSRLPDKQPIGATSDTLLYLRPLYPGVSP